MRWWRVASLFGLSCLLFAATPGEFRGYIVGAEASANGWILVQGRNQLVRKVALGKAEIVYSAEVPAGERRRNAASFLRRGAEVRVHAVQDGAGEWRASRVEILKLPQSEGPESAGNNAKI